MDKKDFHIALDFGHGIEEPGKKSPLYSTAKKHKEYFQNNSVAGKDRFYEWKWNRLLGNRVAQELKDLGYNVHIIVPEDNNISLATRVSRINKLCSKYGAGKVCLVSVHANAAGNAKEWVTARGWCAFTTRGQNNSDKFANLFYKYAEMLLPQYGIKIRKDQSDKDPDWESNFYIIKNSNCPSVLVENLFYDNEDDLKWIISEEGLRVLTDIHVMAIEDWIKER